LSRTSNHTLNIPNHLLFSPARGSVRCSPQSPLAKFPIIPTHSNHFPTYFRSRAERRTQNRFKNFSEVAQFPEVGLLPKDKAERPPLSPSNFLWWALCRGKCARKSEFWNAFGDVFEARRTSRRASTCSAHLTINLTLCPQPLPHSFLNHPQFFHWMLCSLETLMRCCSAHRSLNRPPKCNSAMLCSPLLNNPNPPPARCSALFLLKKCSISHKSLHSFCPP